MLKHSALLNELNTGNPHNFTYVTSEGALSEFVGARKKVNGQSTEQVGTVNKTKRRVGNQYNSLIPIITASGEIREIYSRAIILFNGQEVVL